MFLDVLLSEVNLFMKTDICKPRIKLTVTFSFKPAQSIVALKLFIVPFSHVECMGNQIYYLQVPLFPCMTGLSCECEM